MRGAWIEILPKMISTRCGWSLPVRGAWIEIDSSKAYSPPFTSLPVRGAWIEMVENQAGIKRNFVAPRAGSVD